MAVLPTPGSPISAGLFLVRRERIWMTRSISFDAADHRVELAGARRGGQVDAELVDCTGVLLDVPCRRLACCEYAAD